MSINTVRSKNISNVFDIFYKWERPSDWLNISLNVGDEKIVHLFPVYNNDSNYVSFIYYGGSYTVDWGDGSSTQNYALNQQAEHKYNWSDISSNTLTSEGYRQVLITITPQAGQTFSSFAPRNHSSVPYISGVSTNFLESHIAMSGMSTITYGNTGTPQYYLMMLKRVVVYDCVDGAYLLFAQLCPSLRVIDIKTSKNVKLYSQGQTFQNCYSLSEINFSGGKLLASDAGCMYSAFLYCTNLKKIPYMDTSVCNDFGFAFNACSSITEIPLFNTSNVTSMNRAFLDCVSLLSVPLFDTSNVTSMTYMFRNCPNLTSVPLFNTSKVTNMSFMFYGDKSLLSVPLFNTSNVTDMSNMFSTCDSLTDIPAFDFSKVINLQGFIYGNFKIKEFIANAPLCTTGPSASYMPSLRKLSVTTNATTTLTNVGGSLNSLIELSGFKLATGATITNSNQNFYNLRKFDVKNITNSFNLQNTMLDKDALNYIFTDNLGTPAAARVLTITNSIGATLNPTYSRSSTTVSGSTTITIADTSNFTVGTQVTGTGISTARSVTMQDSGDTVTLVGHGIPNDKLISFATIVTTTGISIYTTYYVVNATADTFQLALTQGGSPIALTNNGSGTILYQTLVTGITTNTSVTVDIPASASGTNTLTYRNLNTQIAVLRNWSVTG